MAPQMLCSQRALATTTAKMAALARSATMTSRQPEREEVMARALTITGASQYQRREIYTSSTGQQYDLTDSNQGLRRHSIYFTPNEPSIANWRARPISHLSRRVSSMTQFQIRLQSTVTAAREAALSIRGVVPGVLSSGAPYNDQYGEQERSLIKASNLTLSLDSRQGRKFYAEQAGGGNGAMFSQAFILSPRVTLVKDGNGQWARPVEVDIVTATAVDVPKFRAASEGTLSDRTIYTMVERTMEARMGRILRVFEQNGNKVLVLGCFGGGTAGNSKGMIAKIWARLLGPGGRFDTSFTSVTFAIKYEETYTRFHSCFMAELQKLHRGQSNALSAVTGASRLTLN